MRLISNPVDFFKNDLRFLMHIKQSRNLCRTLYKMMEVSIPISKPIFMVSVSFRFRPCAGGLVSVSRWCGFNLVFLKWSRDRKFFDIFVV